MYITATYAAILGIVLVALSIRTIGLRRELKIAIGDGGDERMRRAMRVHANFVEYVPITLLLAFFLETSTSRVWMVHFIGGCLVVGRLLHAYGVSQSPEPFRLRVAGMVLTFTALLSAAIGLLVMQGLRLFV